MPLDQLILHGPTVERFRWMINQPYGIIYVTGPTGSGKTTTLYSSLNEINSPEVNISTAEDPVEYDLPVFVRCRRTRTSGSTLLASCAHSSGRIPM